MTVKELRERLECFDDDKPVRIYSGWFLESQDIEGCYIDEHSDEKPVVIATE